MRAYDKTDVLKIEEDHGKFNLKIRRFGNPDAMNGFDTVILACGVAPENKLGLALQEKMDNVFLIGDSGTPGDFRAAVHTAAQVCMNM